MVEITAAIGAVAGVQVVAVDDQQPVRWSVAQAGCERA